MTVSSSVTLTSSLDGQMSRRYTSFPSDVTPAPTTGDVFRGILNVHISRILHPAASAHSAELFGDREKLVFLIYKDFKLTAFKYQLVVVVIEVFAEFTAS